jgi:hypothetical protein
MCGRTGTSCCKFCDFFVGRVLLHCIGLNVILLHYRNADTPFKLYCVSLIGISASSVIQASIFVLIMHAAIYLSWIKLQMQILGV